MFLRVLHVLGAGIVIAEPALSSLRRLPLPLADVPAASRNCQCSGVARSGSKRTERPPLRRSDIVRADTKIDRSALRNGGHWHGKTIQRYRETRAAGFYVRLFLCPAAEKGVGVEMARESKQVVDLGRREETPRDVGVIRPPPDVFDINAHAGGSCNRDEGKAGGVRHIECEPVAEFRTEVGPAECVVNEAYPARLGLEIACEEVTQHPAPGNETLLIALKSKPCTPGAFIRRKRFVEASRFLCRNVHTGAPTMNLVGCESQGARWWQGQRHRG